jgi:protein-tyrosine phosphatase
MPERGRVPRWLRRLLASPRLRAWARWLRHAPDRALHPVRRRTALRRAARAVLGPGRPVLFICTGNICRSPYAAAAFARVGGSIPAASAGFAGPGRGAPPEALAVAARRGVDLSAHRSVLVGPGPVREAGLVVVMAADQARGIRARYGDAGVPVIVLGDLDPLPIRTRTVHDPWNQTEAAFVASYERIDRCIAPLAGALRATG